MFLILSKFKLEYVHDLSWTSTMSASGVSMQQGTHLNVLERKFFVKGEQVISVNFTTLE